MVLTHSTKVRNSLSKAFIDQVNNGVLDIESFKDQKALVRIRFESKAFNEPSNGVSQLKGVPLSGLAQASGLADKFTIRDEKGNEMLTGLVTQTGGGGDIELDNTKINEGQTIQITNLQYSACS